MAYTTRTQIPAEVNNFYDRVMLTRAIPLFVHGFYGQLRKIDNRAGTNVIKFRRYGNLTAATTALTEGTTPGGSQLSVTDITATALQYGDFVTITDIVNDQAIDPVLTDSSEILGDQMGDTNDQLARDILAAGTTIQYASTAVSRVTVATAMTINDTEIKKAVKTLKNGKAKKITRIAGGGVNVGTIPINACYIGIVHPNSTYNLKAATGWAPVETYAANVGTLLPGEVGKLDEVRFIESTNAKVFTGAGAAGIDVYGTIILGADAYGVIDLGNSQASGVIYQGFGSAGSADPLNQRATLGWKEYFVAKILNDAFMIRIEHA
jgi:N4-gp56 family major capsid protein